MHVNNFCGKQLRAPAELRRCNERDRDEKLSSKTDKHDVTAEVGT